MATCFSGCEDDSASNSVTWSGAWEEGSKLFGTFTLSMTFSGDNMIHNGGDGSITGSVSWNSLDGASLISSSIHGTWENTLSSNHDLLRYKISADSGNLTLSNILDYETAGEITDNTFNMGSFSLNSNVGSWHTDTTSSSITIPKVSDAIVVDQNGEFGDISYIDGKIYGTVLNNNDYSLVSIDMSDGTVTHHTPLECALPVAISYDGANTWLIGKTAPDDTDVKLFKYSGTDFSKHMTGFPKTHTDLLITMSISYYDNVLYYHNNSILISAIGFIDQTDASMTPILYDSFGSLPDMARTQKIERVLDGYYTSYFSAGGEWCQIRKLNTSGQLMKTYYSPMNTTGPVAVNGDKLYIIQSNPGRLYTIDL